MITVVTIEYNEEIYWNCDLQ